MPRLLVSVMSRPTRRTRSTANADTPAPQLQDLVFNTQGHAFRPNPTFGVQPTFINAYEPSTTQYKAAIVKSERDDVTIWRPSNLLTEREMQFVEEPGVQKYMVVGFVPRNLEESHKKAASEGRKKVVVGTDRPRDILTHYETELPLIAVAQVVQLHPDEGVKLWVLLKPKSGLCTPHTVAQVSVFYLAQFRDGTAVQRDRGREWNALVKTEINLQAQRTAPRLTEKQENFRRANDTTKPVLHPKMSFSNELTCLAKAFEKSKQPWHLDQLIRTMKEQDEDLAYAPPPSNKSLRKLLDPAQLEHFNMLDAQGVVEEVANLWPEVRLTSEVVLGLKDGLYSGGQVLEYRHIRGFLAYGTRLYEKAQQELDVKAIVNEAIQATAIITPPVQSTPSILADEEGALLTSILRKLKEMQMAGEAYNKDLKDICGDRVFTGDLADIWQKYADAIDTDAAKLAFFQCVRFLAAAWESKYRGLDMMLAELIEVLDEMKLEG